MLQETPYADLTPDLVLQALQAVGLECDGRLLQLNSYENRVFQVGLDDGSFVIAKFYRAGRWTHAQILEEHQFAQELMAAEVPAVAPLSLQVTPHSSLELHTEGHPPTLAVANTLRFALTPRRGGRAPELEDPDVLERTLLAMAEGVSERLRHAGLKAGTVTVKIRDSGFKKAEEFYVALGAGKLQSGAIVNKVIHRLKTDEVADEAAAPAVVEKVVYAPTRKRLPKSRVSRTTSFTVGGAEGYMTAGMYEDGSLGEVFLKLGKQGSTLAGVMDAFSISISIALQYGVPLEAFVAKFTNMRFEPAGLTDDADIRMAQSVMDYIFRRLALDYLPYEKRAALGIFTAEERAAQVAGYDSTPAITSAVEDDVDAVVETLSQSAPVSITSSVAAAVSVEPVQVHSSAELMEAITGKTSDAPLCMTCGIKMRPAGACYACEGCGATSGCS